MHQLLIARGWRGALGGDVRGGGAYRQVVELFGGGTVDQARNRAGRHPHRVHAVEAFGTAFDTPNDLSEIDRYELPAALANTHLVCSNDLFWVVRNDHRR